MNARWTLDHLLGYLGTWSAVSRARDQGGFDPLAEVEPALRGREPPARWQQPTQRLGIHLPGFEHARPGLPAEGLPGRAWNDPWSGWAWITWTRSSSTT